MTNQIDGKAVERLAARLEGTPTYDGSGEICDMPEFAATMLRALLSERDALQAQVERLTKSGICEVAAVNSNVMDCMRHWEGRAEKAEAALSAALARVKVLEAEIERRDEYWPEDVDAEDMEAIGSKVVEMADRHKGMEAACPGVEAKWSFTMKDIRYTLRLARALNQEAEG